MSHPNTIIPADTRIYYGDNILTINIEMPLRDIITSMAEIFPEVIGMDATYDGNIVQFKEMYYWAGQDFPRPVMYKTPDNNQDALIFLERD
jgi:hypothetical protein